MLVVTVQGVLVINVNSPAIFKLSAFSAGETWPHSDLRATLELSGSALTNISLNRRSQMFSIVVKKNKIK
jgi:hypothetical protein